MINGYFEKKAEVKEAYKELADLISYNENLEKFIGSDVYSLEFKGLDNCNKKKANG